MESNWRWNVWDVGWGQSPMRLFARVLNHPVAKWVADVGEPGYYWAGVYPIDPGQPPAPTALPPKEPPFLHFPFGYTVEPD